MKTSSQGADPQRFEERSDDASDISPAAASTGRQKKPPSPRRCRDFIRKETANAMPNIVNRFVGEAKKGSVPHFNALAKVGGFDQRSVPANAPKRRRRSLAQQLLDEVEKYEAKQAAESVARAASAGNGPSSQERS